MLWIVSFHSISNQPRTISVNHTILMYEDLVAPSRKRSAPVLVLCVSISMNLTLLFDMDVFSELIRRDSGRDITISMSV
jgi:hypothetical protein